MNKTDDNGDGRVQNNLRKPTDLAQMKYSFRVYCSSCILNCRCVRRKVQEVALVFRSLRGSTFSLILLTYISLTVCPCESIRTYALISDISKVLAKSIIFTW